MNDFFGEKAGQDIQKQGAKLHAMNALENMVDGRKFLIREKQIMELIMVMRTMEYQFADPAIRELRSLIEIDEYIETEKGT